MKTWSILFVLSFIFLSCSNDLAFDLPRNWIKVVTLPAQDVGIYSALLTGEIYTEIEGPEVVSCGFVWSTTDSLPQILGNNEGYQEIDSTGAAGEPFCQPIEGLQAGSKYFARAFAQTAEKYHYGETITFRTSPFRPTMDSIIYLGGSLAHVFGNLPTLNPSSPISQYGFCWSEINMAPSLEDDFVNLGSPAHGGEFSAEVSGLKNKTTYHFRSFILFENETLPIFSENFTYQANLRDVWESIEEEFPGAVRSFAIGFSLHGKGYVGLGSNVSFQNKDLYEFDPSRSEGEKWKQMDDYPGNGTEYALSFTIGDFAYVGIGSGNNCTGSKELFRFDPAAPGGSQWQQMEEFPGEGRDRTWSFSDGNYGFVGFGRKCPDDGLLNAAQLLYRFDPNGNPQWEQLPTPTAGPSTINHRQGAMSFFTNGKAYMAGGGVPWPLNPSGPTDELWVYDPNQGWTEGPVIEFGTREYGVGFSIDGKGYIVNGSSNGLVISRNLWQYDPENPADPWSEKADYPGVMGRFPVAFVIDGKAYIGTGGGWFADINKEFWVYYP